MCDARYGFESVASLTQRAARSYIRLRTKPAMLTNGPFEAARYSRKTGCRRRAVTAQAAPFLLQHPRISKNCITAKRVLATIRHSTFVKRQREIAIFLSC
jgi:hypothetical protein